MAVWTFLDWIVVAIFLLSITFGFVRGFVSQIISLIALIAAVAIAITFSNSLAVNIVNYSFVQTLIARTSNAFGGNTTDAISYIALGISFLTLFAATIIAGSLLNLTLKFAFSAGILGIGNRILGGIFGLAKGFILNVVLLFLIQLTPLTSETWWQQSYFVPIFQSSTVWLDGQVTPAIQQIKAKLENLNINPQLQGIINSPSSLFQK